MGSGGDGVSTLRLYVNDFKLVPAIRASMGTSCDVGGVPGEESSGLAMRKPPNDWERLKSWFIMATLGGLEG